MKESLLYYSIDKLLVLAKMPIYRVSIFKDLPWPTYNLGPTELSPAPALAPLPPQAPP